MRSSLGMPVASRGGADVGGLRPLLALGHLELHPLVLGECLEAGALDLAEVDEQVLAAAVRGDEAEALLLVEPLHGSGLGRHVVSLSTKCCATAHAGAVQRRQVNQGDSTEARC